MLDREYRVCLQLITSVGLSSPISVDQRWPQSQSQTKIVGITTRSEFGAKAGRSSTVRGLESVTTLSHGLKQSRQSPWVRTDAGSGRWRVGDSVPEDGWTAPWSPAWGLLNRCCCCCRCCVRCCLLVQPAARSS